MALDIETIKHSVNTTLMDCLPKLQIHEKMNTIVRKKMLDVIRKNKEIGRLGHLDTIVFILMIHAIKELKLPINKGKMNDFIKDYIEIKNIVKHLENFKISSM